MNKDDKHKDIIAEESDKIYTILYFMDYGKAFGGAARTLLQQAMLMERAGNKVVVFFSTYLGSDMNEEYLQIYSQYGFKTKYAIYQISSQPEDIDVICLNENYEKLKKEIVALKPDVLHSVQINPMVELISRELDIPHIMNIYQLAPFFFGINYIDVFPHYHICDSLFWAKQWNKYLNTDYVCIRTSINIGEFHKKIRSSKGKKRYICVGTISERKNQLKVIEAFHKAMKKGLTGELFLYGYDNGVYAEKCKRYIKHNALESSIVLKGFFKDMKSAYLEGDVLICGSIIESYPNVISEAMAYGLIVISTPVAGVPEILEDRINGYLTEDYTIDAICKKILEVDEDIKKNKVDSVLKNAHKAFLLNHSSEIVTENLLKYYRHVVQDTDRISTIGISDIRKIFDRWIHIFAQNYNKFTNPQKVATKIWYLSYIMNDIESARQRNAQFYIWGTGQYGIIVKEMVDTFFPDVDIAGFIDSKKDGKFFGYEIFNPDEILKEENIVVFVAVVNGQNEILSQLEDSGLFYNKDYFILAARYW